MNNQERNLKIIEASISHMLYCYADDHSVFFHVPATMIGKKNNLMHVAMHISATHTGINFKATAPVSLPISTDEQRKMVLKHLCEENFGTVRGKLMLHEDNTLEAFVAMPVIDAFLKDWEDDDKLPEDVESEFDTTVEVTRLMLVRTYSDVSDKLFEAVGEDSPEEQLLRLLATHKQMEESDAGEEAEADAAAVKEKDGEEEAEADDAAAKALEELFASLGLADAEEDDE